MFNPGVLVFTLKIRELTESAGGGGHGSPQVLQNNAPEGPFMQSFVCCRCAGIGYIHSYV
jgi:hypothetical protein